MSETKKCKHCQTDIPKKAKVCPNCRKKQSGVGKWIAIVLVFLFIIGSAGAEDDTPQKVEGNANTETVVNNAPTEESSNVFGVGDTAEYNGVVVTLNSIEESKGSDFNKPTEGNVYVLVNFTIENNTDSDLAVSSLLSFTAYQDGYATNMSLAALMEKDGEQLDGTIAPGKKMRGTIGYEIPTGYSEFEINYQADMWDDEKFSFVYTK